MQRDDFREDLPVSRGQWRALALAAIRHIGEDAPETRFQATELLARFRISQTGEQADDAAAAGGGGRG
jgi:hypothetical protein